MSERLSVKIQVVSFFCMILIVFIHSSSLISYTGQRTETLRIANTYLQYLMCDGICRIAVPIFATVSGFLFYLNFKWSFVTYQTKLKKRFKSLVIPYLFWSLFSILVYYLLELVPALHQFFSKGLIVNYTREEVLRTIFLTPLAYQLWFVRDLIVLVIISPVLYFLIKYLKFVFVLFVLAVWFLGINLLIITPETLAFFVLGGFLSFNAHVLADKKTYRYWAIFFLLWIILIAVKSYLNVFGGNDITKILLLKVIILIGVPVIWFGFDNFFYDTNFKAIGFYKYMSLSFFLYAFHEPFLTIVKKVLFFILGHKQVVSLLIFFIAPAITITSTITIGYILKRNLPRFFGLISGGRA